MDNQEVAVNLIITDYCMPGMTGYDLLKKIKVATIFFCLCFLVWSIDDPLKTKGSKDVCLFCSSRNQHL